jgi:molybdopterin molybdotransferase
MTALEKGQLLSPAAVGFIAGLGLSSANVIPAPRVSIIITGNELQKPGSPLAYGQVYESNSFSLTAALHDAGISNITTIPSGDNLDELTGFLYSALEKSDIVLLTGGVSVGDYDFVTEAAKRCKIETIFYKVKQRPGKPLFFGKTNKALVFGLPGNPSSVLTCFYEYVLPAMEQLTNRNLGLKTTRAKLAKPFNKTIALTFFLKGFYDGQMVTILDAQESYKLSSFAKANCLVKLDEEAKEYHPAEEVEVHLLPI